MISAGRYGELMYYVTPFIKGESLRERLASPAKLSIDEAGRLIGEVLGAVSFAHARGVIHRDIKPANVLLSEGHAILADFGIARALANPDDDQVTFSGTVIGTPTYMAPERPRDEHADLYAVAVMSYEVLVGSPPPNDRSRETIARELASSMPRAQAARARRIGAVLSQALSADPQRRYQTAKEFREAFQRSVVVAPPRNWLRVAVAVLVVSGAAVFGERELAQRNAAIARSAAARPHRRSAAAELYGHRLLQRSRHDGGRLDHGGTREDRDRRSCPNDRRGDRVPLRVASGRLTGNADFPDRASGGDRRRDRSVWRAVSGAEPAGLSHHRSRSTGHAGGGNDHGCFRANG